MIMATEYEIIRLSQTVEVTSFIVYLETAH